MRNFQKNYFKYRFVLVYSGSFFLSLNLDAGFYAYFYFHKVSNY